MGRVTDGFRLAAALKNPTLVAQVPVFLDPTATQVARFWIAKSPVTEAAYMACVAAGACTRAASSEGCGGGGNLPVNCVSYAQATTYCAATGGRLPTEAEWEFAARGPKGRIFPWGDTWNDAMAYGNRHPVGACRVRDTPDGIHDLAGNGREWTSTGSGDTRVSKGMECAADLPCVAFNRFLQPVDEQHDYLGFRCARSTPPGPPPPFVPARPPAPPAARAVHWSDLIDTFPVARGPVPARTVCFVEVRFDPSGRVVSATALTASRPEQPACPASLRAVAESQRQRPGP